MIYAERVISTDAKLPPLVGCVLEQLGNDTDILDIGAGDGRLGRALACRPDMKVFGLEYDTGLALSAADGPGRQRLAVGDVRAMPFRPDTFGAVTAINTLHEVVDGASPAERFGQLNTVIAGITRVLRPGGMFIMHDGVMPDAATQPVTIRPLHEQAAELLMRFGREYTARPPVLASQSQYPRVFVSDIASAVTFLTKYNYLKKGDAWQGERKQLYPFASYSEIIAALKANNMKVTSTQTPDAQTRKGLANVLADYAITRVSDNEPYTSQTFPHCQMLITAQKRITRS